MTDLDSMLDKIDHTLHSWETVKGAYGLSSEIIEEGNRIIVEERAKRQ